MAEKVSTVHRGAGQASTRGGGGARARPGGCDMASQSGAIKRPGRFPGINVDGFQFQSPDAKVYVLTHFHADHYCGLSSSFGRSKGSTEAKNILFHDHSGARGRISRREPRVSRGLRDR